jgi:branched-chain amino acid transport system permease protein
MPLWVGIPSRAWISAAMLVGVTGFLSLAICITFGNTGINITTLVLLQIAGVLALATFSGNSGIVSFGHSAFMGIGAYVSGVLTMGKAVQASALPQLPSWLQGHELPLGAAIIAVMAAGLLAGVLTGFPLSRLSTGSASIGTLAFLIIIHVLLNGAREITRGSQTFYGVPRLTNVYVAFAVAGAFIFIARLLRDTPLGLKLRASRENEVAATANGVNVQNVRYGGWIVSVVMASIVGALYGHFLGAFSPKDFYFDLVFMLIAMLIVGGMLTVTGAVAGAILLAAVVQLLRHAETGVDLGFMTVPGVFGLPQLGMGIALLLTIWLRPLGLVGLHEMNLPWFSSKQTVVPNETIEIYRPVQQAKNSSTPGCLSVKNISMRFGGLVALDNISFDVMPGKVTGLIGPNGAGKTTLINIICGQLQPTEGSVAIDGNKVTGNAAHSVAVAGLGRTFQNIRLFDRMTALENVMVAALSKGLKPVEAQAMSFAQLSRLGLSLRWDELAGNFAYGDRRRLEIARALALSPTYLLLDEPAAGMNPMETDDLILILERLRADHNIGLLVVEHDMRLIMRLSDHMVVLNKGQKIAEGMPNEIRSNQAVIEAYIGTKRKVIKHPKKEEQT